MAHNPFSLSGKTILVTGASSGIGQRTAIECANLGATLIITGRNEERIQSTLATLATEEHQQHTAISSDLSTPEGVEALVAQVEKLDGLVLSAGKGLTLPFQFCSRDKFTEVFNINFFSPVETLRLLAKKKKFNSNASVVAVSSIGGNFNFNPGNDIYGASKAALRSIMRTAANELASKKIRVNCVCPGMVVTPLTQASTITQEQLDADAQSYPLKRYGQPEDVAYGIVYLLSDAASWITGQSLIIDGGKTI